MSDATADETEEQPKSSKMPMILGLVAALVGGGGGFFAVYSGAILAPEAESPAMPEDQTVEAIPLPDIEYVPIEPMIVSIGELSDRRHLRFTAQLEVHAKYKQDVEKLMPRIQDVINTYLRVVELEDLERSAILAKFRAHLLSRIDIVTGRGRVNDLLITEFVVN